MKKLFIMMAAACCLMFTACNSTNLLNSRRKTLKCKPKTIPAARR